MPELRCRSGIDLDIENTAGTLCERYLPGVLHYLNYWVNDSEMAEELTLKAFKKALAKHGNCYRDEKRFSIGIFTCARNEILDYLKTNTTVPVLPGLSVQEQDVISLRLAAVMNNRMISKLLGLPESRVSTIICETLCKLRDHMEVPA